MRYFILRKSDRWAKINILIIWDLGMAWTHFIDIKIQAITEGRKYLVSIYGTLRIVRIDDGHI